MKVIIIGAGISGLAAAYTLKKKGIETTVFEKDALPGGRTRGAKKEGFVLDHGAQFFMKCYDATYSFVHEFDLKPEAFHIRHKSAFWLDERRVPDRELKIPILLVKSLANPSGLHMSLLKSRLQTGKLLTKIIKDRKALDFVDYEKALDYDSKYFSDVVLRYAGKDALEHVFEPLIAGITLGKAEEIGALYGVALFWNLLLGNWILKSGVHSIAERLYHEIQSSVELSTPVHKIIVENNRAIGVETKEGVIKADAVVCSTTATAALNLISGLPDAIRAILEKVQYRACCHVVFAFDRPVIPDGASGIMLPRKSGSTMSGIIDSAFYSDSYAPPGTSLIHCYTWDRFAYDFNRMADGDIIAHLVGELKKYIPTLPKHPMFTEIYRWDEAMCFAPPGMYQATNKLKSLSGREVKGLYFAGDYLNLASVEGSARSGIAAAEAILK